MTADERELIRAERDNALRAAKGLPAADQYRRRVYPPRNLPKGSMSSFCVYCGDRIRNATGSSFAMGLTCKEHEDLPLLDWRYGGTTGEVAA